jgi:hypothetical protein
MYLDIKIKISMNVYIYIYIYIHIYIYYICTSIYIDGGSWDIYMDPTTCLEPMIPIDVGVARRDAVRSVSCIVCMLMPLAGLYFCVGLDFVTPSL